MDSSEETLLKLQEKNPSIHPDRQLPMTPDEDDDDGSICSVITKEDVRLRIRSFRSGSGEGSDG